MNSMDDDFSYVADISNKILLPSGMHILLILDDRATLLANTGTETAPDLRSIWTLEADRNAASLRVPGTDSELLLPAPLRFTPSWKGHLPDDPSEREFLTAIAERLLQLVDDGVARSFVCVAPESALGALRILGVPIIHGISPDQAEKEFTAELIAEIDRCTRTKIET